MVRLWLACLLSGVAPAVGWAQSAPAPASAPAPVVDDNAIQDYVANWFQRVQEAKDSQPSWMTPLVTVTPRLEEEVRYDQFWERLPNGGNLDNFDAGKGLELIPTTTNEVIIGALPYIQKTVHGKQTDGFGDGPTVLIKQRLFSENAADGDAIVTAFLAVTPSAGGEHFSQHAVVITPTLAAGKGWGAFDVQATTGLAVPTRRFGDLGTQWLTNVALQYHVAKYFWPEFEVNDTVWLNGSSRGGKNQIFLTPGIIFGRFAFGSELRGAIGVGYQVAVSPRRKVEPELDPMYDHNWILSARLSF